MVFHKYVQRSFIDQFPKTLSFSIVLQHVIQNQDPQDTAPVGGRPSRAEIRWYGATDAGLWDVRENVQLWGMDCEIERHDVLSAMEENKDKSRTEVSDMVVKQRWDLKRRKEIYELHGLQYDGGDL